MHWPPRSCDLTPLDYFLWGYVKSLVYADKPQTLDHLEDNICRVIADIRPQMLEKVIENWTSRLDYIRASRWCEPSRRDQRGPVFRTEPSSRVEFSNSSGTELRCSSDGIPNPRLSWQTRDGGNTRDVPGLRYTRSDGTLVFPPFPRSDYRQDVHDTVYQCLASNAVGSIVSREVHVRGGESSTSFPVENTSLPYSGFEPKPTRLQAEGHIHHTG
ncbi:down syndrome cell adhesion molecule-like protein Dscam2 [Trichonephila clavipes]|nr:down syndrome cell adhesion molecule-like protein Dscam2 [Trichonephila clavipes]